MKPRSWSTELQFCRSLRTLQLTQKPQRTTTRKRGKETICTNTIYFQYYIFISQVFCSPGHLLMLWSDSSALIDCMGCSFILRLLTLFFQWFFFVFFPKMKRECFRDFFMGWQQTVHQYTTPNALQTVLHLS